MECSFPGFRSRWTITPSVSRVDCLRNLGADSQNVSDSEFSPDQAVFQGLALKVLHHEILGPTLRADVEEHSNVRVLELGDRLRLPLQAFLIRLVPAQLGG